MMIRKNSVPLTLMITSIVLLLVLQVLWLRGAYYDAADNFRRETSLLFKSTVFSMHDSLIQRSIQPIESDSLFRNLNRNNFVTHRDTGLVAEALPPPESLIDYVNFKNENGNVELYVTSPHKKNNNDSIPRILRPLLSKFHTRKHSRRFLIRLGADSLKPDSIAFHYRHALVTAGIDAPFKVISIKKHPGDRSERKIDVAKGEMVSDPVGVSPMRQYAVAFSGIDSLLFKTIMPQILFSVFVTLLTIGAFYFLYQNLRTQQRLMTIKNDFISNVTHELKTPVATVSVALEALKDFHALDDPKRTKEYLEMAQTELNRLTLMTDKILKTSAYENKGVELALESVNLDILISEILTSLKLVFERKKIQVSYQKAGVDFTLDAGREHLSNVVYNLLDNAIKYTGDEASISINLKDQVDTLTLSVRDNGIGIPTEYKKKIFEKFFRVPSGDVHNTNGYGLGLSYVASVVKSHQGRVEVDSEPGKGSCFTVTLPKHISQSGL